MRPSADGRALTRITATSGGGPGKAAVRWFAGKPPRKFPSSRDRKGECIGRRHNARIITA